MTLRFHLPPLVLLFLSGLAACGGEKTLTGPQAAPPPSPRVLPSAPVSAPVSSGGIRAPEGKAADAVFGVTIKNISGKDGRRIPVTFAQLFRPGDVPARTGLRARLRGRGTLYPTQVDTKARHPDGSLRHAVITVMLPSLPRGKHRDIEFVRGGRNASGGTPRIRDLLATSFDAVVTLRIDGVPHRVSARRLLMSGNKYANWLAGPLVREWQLVSAPIAPDGRAHPHLSVRFSLRAYAGLERIRVGVVVENTWAYEPNPRNHQYDLSVELGGKTVYTREALTHYRQARWRKLFWWGGEPGVDVRHDKVYLLSTDAVPQYDDRIRAPESVLAAMARRWKQVNIGPMGAGIVSPDMPGTGARPDIGPLPRWAAFYLLSMDARAKTVTLGTGETAGSWPVHYRDKKTDLPVTIDDYPYMTLLGNDPDTYNPATGKYEVFPACAGNCATPFGPDSAHQPSLAFVPYLVTGDVFYLEELQFWANWNILRAQPGAREFTKGLLKWGQVRAQAWSLRTLAQAAYITPDGHPMKHYFLAILDNNLAWYNRTHTRANVNRLGYLTENYVALSAMGSWMDDFFTWAVGYTVALGFDAAKPLLAWKARFPVGRMTAPGFCWIFAAPYNLKVGDDVTGERYGTFARTYRETVKASYPDRAERLLQARCGGRRMAALLERRPGEMLGYADDDAGFPANLQPALAVAVESGIEHAEAAWMRFTRRPIQPTYLDYPNYAIVPRNRRP